MIHGQPDGMLLTDNPNANNPANGANAINPFRLDRSQASTCDQDHNYGNEQKAFNQGLMDSFPASVGVGESSFCAAQYARGKDKGLVLGYFDGNTVTALWNYAQQFAMSDNSYGTTFGPSTPGLLNLGGDCLEKADRGHIAGFQSFEEIVEVVLDFDGTHALNEERRLFLDEKTGQPR